MHSILSRAGLVLSLFSLPAFAQESGDLIKLRYGTFDPLEQVVEAPALLGSQSSLWIVQFEGAPQESTRQAVRATGAEIHGYLPDNAYVVRMSAGEAATVTGVDGIRWVGPYYPAFRLEPELITAFQTGEALPTQRYNIVVVDRDRDKPALGRQIVALGGAIDNEQPGSILFTVTLTKAQLLKTANLDQVLWIDRWTLVELDMNNARIQGGGDYVEAQGGYTGTGVNAHIYEGIDASHPAFSGPVINVRSGGASTGHGTNTAGIVFGDGTGNPTFRGMAPDVGKFYTTYSSVVGSRWQVVSDLVNIHDVSFTTASWGGGRTTQYTSVSADADNIIFDHDISWTQSQSNAGNQMSRPQAWAKNIFSIGGVAHYDNSDPTDDSWAGGGASTGPAADGRIKPTLCAYYDAIGTTSQGGGYTTGFGGTSGATPIVAGHNALAIQMFTDGIFGNTLRNPGGSRHSNRPHFTTLKALQIASAAQYVFTSTSADNRREHQGWGFPNLRSMWDNRTKTLIVDETDILTQGNSTTYNVTVGASEPEFKVCMTYNDPAANPSAGTHRVNDLSLRVTSPGGTVYWGNNGLQQGNYSGAGGSEDNINTVECVFVSNPTPGNWTVEVLATLVVQDSHVETPAVDADYGLVAAVGGVSIPIPGQFNRFGQGCPGSVVGGSCGSLNPGGGTLTNASAPNEYAYVVNNTGSVSVVGFDLFTASSGGSSATVNAYIYADSGGSPATNPSATTTLTAGSTPGFYNATFPAPVAMSGTFYISVDHTAGTVYLSNLSSGTSGGAYWRRPAAGGGSWALSGIVSIPSWVVNCSAGNAAPSLTNTGLPETGLTYSVNVSQAAPNMASFLVTGFSDSSYSGGSLPAPLPGAPGCDLLVSPTAWDLRITSGSGTASSSLLVPNSSALVGFMLYHQWLVQDPGVNTLGFVTSGGGRATIGG